MASDNAPTNLITWDEAAIPEDKAVHITESLVEIKTNPDILSFLTEPELELLIERGQVSSYKKDEFFFQQGEVHEGIHFIRSGRIRSFYISPAGREITLAYWPAGHFVGAPQIYGGGEHMWSSVAVEPSVGLWLPGNVLHKLIREIPNLAIGVIEGLIYKGKLYTALVQVMGTRSITMRLAHLLLTLADTDRREDRGELLLSENFTQEELANMIGATRQSISLMLERFEKDGLISRKDQAIRLLNVDGLEDICF